MWDQVEKLGIVGDKVEKQKSWLHEGKRALEEGSHPLIQRGYEVAP